MERLCDDCMSEQVATHKGFASPAALHIHPKSSSFQGQEFVVTPIAPKGLNRLIFLKKNMPARCTDAHPFTRGSGESKLAVRVLASLQRQLDDNPVGVTLLKVKHTHALALFPPPAPSTFLCLSLPRTCRL